MFFHISFKITLDYIHSARTMPTTTAERVIIRVVTGRLSEKPDSDMANPLFSAVQQAVDHGNEH